MAAEARNASALPRELPPNLYTTGEATTRARMVSGPQTISQPNRMGVVAV